MDRKFELQVLDEALDIIKQESYLLGKKRVFLHYSEKEREQTKVYLPEEVHEICDQIDTSKTAYVMGRCGFGVHNMDSFTGAAWQYKNLEYLFSEKHAKTLVLNFANPVHPGGGVRKGARAQEENLCRKSTLLQSLESKAAERYYEYHRHQHTYLGSDAMILSPNVEVFFDDNYNLLDEPFSVAVLTCAAPMVKLGLEGKSKETYRDLLHRRIECMVKMAIHFDYQHLILGAWGCGAFGNDAELISDLFYQVLKELDIDHHTTKDFFRRIDFAVLDRTKDLYNYNAFIRNFDNFYRDEDEAEENRYMEKAKGKEVHLDAIKGCLYGGAVGDALGYPVEFDSLSTIQQHFGEQGITAYVLDEGTKKALISDDTQMTLFTATGILLGDTRMSLRGIGANPSCYIGFAYKDWLKTQQYRAPLEEEERRDSWLAGVSELYSRRAPGNTCIQAISGEKYGSVKEHINTSKGCGGVMRVAPLGIHYDRIEDDRLCMEGAEIAALTHGHSLGYMPAATLTMILNRIVFHKAEYDSLKEIVMEAKQITDEVFRGDHHLDEIDAIIVKAVELSENQRNDEENIRELGEGWVAEETLAIAIYCALRYTNDFSQAVITAVNHNGDSDSTGSVTGNIVGAWIGYDGIEQIWKENLELSDVILEVAEDLCHGCNMSEYSSYRDEAWETKYIHMQPYK